MSDDLTATELRVLTLLSNGMSSYEIAFESGRSYETIASQRKAVIRKLGANTMPHAVAIALRDGLIE